MTTNAKILFDGAAALLSEIAGVVTSDLSEGSSSEKIDKKVQSYISYKNLWSAADDDILKLIAVAELELLAVQSKFINLEGVDPESAVFSLAFTSIFAKQDLISEAKELITKRTELLHKLVTHTEGINQFGQVLMAAKLPEQAVSLNLSQAVLNKEGCKKLESVCKKNIGTYQAMINRRKGLISELNG